MKAKVTGKSAWQGVPDDGYLNIHIIGDRWADAHGNATVSRYSGRLNPGKTGFGDAKNPAADLYIPVQGPGDPDGPLARFEEILVYGGETVRSEYTRRLIATDLDGLIFDYAAPEPTSLPPSFGQAPLTIQAAQQLLDTGTAKIAQVDQKLIQVDDSLADIAQAQADNNAAQAANNTATQTAITQMQTATQAAVTNVTAAGAAVTQLGTDLDTAESRRQAAERQRTVQFGYERGQVEAARLAAVTQINAMVSAAQNSAMTSADYARLDLNRF